MALFSELYIKALFSKLRIALFSELRIALFSELRIAFYSRTITRLFTYSSTYHHR
jgi:hypothetical protein